MKILTDEQVQSQYDAAMEELPHLDFSNQGALLAWFEKIQPATDNGNVRTTSGEWLKRFEAFEAHGYHARFKPLNGASTADDSAHFIIGQCMLDPIHPKVVYDIQEWRKKFQP